MALAQRPANEPAGAGDFFLYQGKPRPLTPVPGLLAVHYELEDHTRALRDLLGEPLDGLSLARETNRMSLFAHPEASATAELGLAPAPTPAVRPAIRPLIDRLVAILDGPYSFSPIFRSPRGGLVTFGNHVLAELEPWLEPAEREQLIASVGGVLVSRRLGGVESAVHFRVPRARTARDVLAVANRLARDSRVVWAEPDFTILNPTPAAASACVPLSPLPTTAERSHAWWIDGPWGINLTGAWDLCGGEDAFGQPLVRIGIVDEGVDLTHPDLYKLGATVPGKGFVSSQPSETLGAHVDPTCEGHGTEVAGMIAMVTGGPGSTSSTQGGVGAAPKVEIVSARAHAVQGAGCSDLAIDQSDISNAFQWLVAPPPTGAGAKVISYSWNYTFGTANVDMIIQNAAANDVMVFVSVGNGDLPSISYPSTAPGAISVGGTDQAGKRWRAPHPSHTPPPNLFWGSNFGPGLRFVAPATDLYTTDWQGSPGFDPGDWVSQTVGTVLTQPLSGTSFATPLVAAVAALVRARNPDLTASQVEQILCDTATPVPNWGAPGDSRVQPPPECGLVNAAAAMLAADTIFLDGFETGDTSQWSQEVQ